MAAAEPNPEPPRPALRRTYGGASVRAKVAPPRRPPAFWLLAVGAVSSILWLIWSLFGSEAAKPQSFPSGADVPPAVRLRQAQVDLERHFAQAEAALQAGELAFALGHLAAARRLLDSWTSAPISADDSLGAPRRPPSEIATAWQARLQTASVAGSARAIDRLSRGQERMSEVAAVQLNGFSVLAASIEQHAVAIRAQRLAAARNIVRILIDGPPDYVRMLEAVLREKAPAEFTLIFEPALSREENSATWRTLAIAALIANVPYQGSERPGQNITIEVPGAAKLMVVCYAGPGPASSWDDLPEMVVEVDLPERMRGKFEGRQMQGVFASELLLAMTRRVRAEWPVLRLEPSAPATAP